MGTDLCTSWICAGTIPPIKSPLEKNDDVKKLFSIGCPVILVTLGVALLFIIRKKRKEKRLKRLRGKRWSKGRGDKWKDWIGKQSKAEILNKVSRVFPYFKRKKKLLSSLFSRCQKPGRDADKVRLLVWKTIYCNSKLFSQMHILLYFFQNSDCLCVCVCSSDISELVKTTAALTPQWRGLLRAHDYTSTSPEYSCWLRTKKASSKSVRARKKRHLSVHEHWIKRSLCQMYNKNWEALDTQLWVFF